MQALAGVYDVMGTDGLYGQGLIYHFAAGTDIHVFNRTKVKTKHKSTVYTHATGSAEVLAAWRALYDGINRANSFLENIDNVPSTEIEESVRNQYTGEARFLRGYYYFLLVSNWGEVPLKLKSTQSVTDVNIAKSTIKDIYDQIILDMESAELLVEKTANVNSPSHVTSSAVQGILARVNLYMAGFPLNDVTRFADAKKWAQKVIDSGTHSLNVDYKQIFINHTVDKYDVAESIFEVEFFGNRLNNAVEETGRLGAVVGISSRSIEIGYAYAMTNATLELYNKFESNDVRRDWNIAPYRYSKTTTKIPYADDALNRYPGKWRREYEVVLPKNKNFTPTNVPLLRYSDVLLMFAEAENQLNGPTDLAYNAVNLIRNRASASPITTGLTKEQFHQQLVDERARELCFEGFRRNDLIRWGIFLKTMKASAASITATGGKYAYTAAAGNNVSERHLFLPIPEEELSLNKLISQTDLW